MMTTTFLFPTISFDRLRCENTNFNRFSFLHVTALSYFASKLEHMTGWIIFAVVALGGFVYFLLKYTKEPH